MPIKKKAAIKKAPTKKLIINKTQLLTEIKKNQIEIRKLLMNKSMSKTERTQKLNLLIKKNTFLKKLI